ncbi:O-antigen ligase domain-containing protein [Desulfosporosinus fructosivorans]|uniref:O-antigen ligase domain-containing protein n=1 Tax=Desulfosporosinus fructosivorans TaxID=2018669 RepID=A0A4Z0QVM1_9FIRM|nr:O-antigen ligase family protein [Desulfosporosinus fructosivorans]TGE34862.1 O-antigen ligase domain-containing protein [Desulfosporosinus fructosivorans]
MAEPIRSENNMTSYPNMKLIPHERKMLVLLLLSTILIYPNSPSGGLSYLPHLLLGIIAVYAIAKIPVIKPAYSFLFFANYMMISSFLFSSIYSEGIINVFISSMRLFFPFLAMIVGGLLRSKIKVKSLLGILLFLLLMEFVVVFLQINNSEFRALSYNIYRANNSADRLLASFIYSTGQRGIGTIGNPNSLGIFVIALNSAILILSNTYSKKLIRNILNALCISVTTYIVINSQSRTAAILLVVTIGVIIYWKLTNRSKSKLIMLIISIFPAIWLLNMIQAEISRDISLVALDTRFEVWQMLISEMYDHASYSDIFVSIFGVGYHTARSWGFYDNIYLKVFVSAGIVGILVFLGTIISIHKSMVKMANNEFKQLAAILVLIWLATSMVVEFQEIFKIAAFNFILIGYALYPDKGKES